MKTLCEIEYGLPLSLARVPLPRSLGRTELSVKGLCKGESSFSNIEEFYQYVRGHDVITSLPEKFFQSVLFSLLPEDCIRSIYRNGEGVFQDIFILVEDANFQSFSFRKYGTDWKIGKSWYRNLDDFLFPEGDLAEQYEKLLSELLVFDRIAPVQQMAQELILKTSASQFPILKDGEIEERVLRIAFNCSIVGRMEARLVGRDLRDLIDIDANVFYGEILSKMPNLKGAKWICDRRYREGADLGFCVIELQLPPDIEGPVPFRFNHLGEDTYFPCNGQYRLHIAKPELDLILSLGYKFEILEGWWGFVKHKELFPFGESIEIMKQLMETHRSIAKPMASMSWAETIAYRNGSCSPLFNPIYAAEVTSRARRKIFELSMELGDRVVAYTIDGLIFYNGKLPSISISRELGDFKIRRGNISSYTDYHRRNSFDKPSWKETERGILVDRSDRARKHLFEISFPEEETVIPYGSSLREASKQNLTYTDLKERFELSSPDPKGLIAISERKFFQN